MDIDKLLVAGKIKQEDYEVFLLYELSETGKKYLTRMINATFMEEPDPSLATGEAFAYCDGRRSIFRRIKFTIDHIYNLLRASNDN